MSEIPPSTGRPRRLIVAIHDVSPRFADEVEQLRDLAARHFPPGHIAMLVVPDHWGSAPLLPSTPFARRLRGWAEGGSEMFVHGWFHRDDSRHSGRLARLQARQMTAGEGEFLGLSEPAARERMETGRALVEEVTGRPVAGFVAPAWLYSAGAIAAARSLAFPVCEDHLRVWQPSNGNTLCRGPVISWASRSRGRVRASIAAASLLRRLLRPLPVVRLALHPGDIGVPGLVASIDRTLATLSPAREAARYADLLPTAPGRARMAA